MKNKEFFYLQYNKINWRNQEKTKINAFIYEYIIKEITKNKKEESIKIFDIGAGIGLLLTRLDQKLKGEYKKVILVGCEPSEKNYKYLIKKIHKRSIAIYNKPFLGIKEKRKFDFIIATYVFPSIIYEELEYTIRKIYSMLEKDGKFILVVANEEYLNRKLKTKKDLFIEENIINFKGKKYKEILHYVDIPEIGKVIDYNREEVFYLDIFKESKFKLMKKENLKDSGFVCTVYIFKR